MENRPSKRLNILLVEDDEISQRLFCLLFDRLGHNVDVASNGAEGVAAVKERNYDLVFMDIQMPVLNGLDATRQIRALEEDRKNIPIIAITASDLRRDEKLSIAAGMNDHVSKPFDLKRIQQVIDAFRGGLYQNLATVADGSVPSQPRTEDSLLDSRAALPFFNNNVIQYTKYLQEFIQSLPHRMQMMEDALRSGNWEIVGNESHNLKGTSASLGAMKLSKLAARLDKLADEQAKGEAIKILQEMKDVVSNLVDLTMD